MKLRKFTFVCVVFLALCMLVQTSFAREDELRHGQDDFGFDDNRSRSRSDDSRSGNNNRGFDDRGGDRLAVAVLRGLVTAISANTVTIGNNVFLLTSGTKFEDEVGQRVGISYFAEGDIVKIKYQAGSAVAPVVYELEAEDDLRFGQVILDNLRAESGRGRNNSGVCDTPGDDRCS